MDKSSSIKMDEASAVYLDRNISPLLQTDNCGDTGNAQRTENLLPSPVNHRHIIKIQNDYRHRDSTIANATGSRNPIHPNLITLIAPILPTDQRTPNNLISKEYIVKHNPTETASNNSSIKPKFKCTEAMEMSSEESNDPWVEGKKQLFETVGIAVDKSEESNSSKSFGNPSTDPTLTTDQSTLDDLKMKDNIGKNKPAEVSNLSTSSSCETELNNSRSKPKLSCTEAVQISSDELDDSWEMVETASDKSDETNSLKSWDRLDESEDPSELSNETYSISDRSMDSNAFDSSNNEDEPNLRFSEVSDITSELSNKTYSIPDRSVDSNAFNSSDNKDEPNLRPSEDSDILSELSDEAKSLPDSLYNFKSLSSSISEGNVNELDLRLSEESYTSSGPLNETNTPSLFGLDVEEAIALPYSETVLANEKVLTQLPYNEQDPVYLFPSWEPFDVDLSNALRTLDENLSGVLDQYDSVSNIAEIFDKMLSREYEDFQTSRHILNNFDEIVQRNEETIDPNMDLLEFLCDYQPCQILEEEGNMERSMAENQALYATNSFPNSLSPVFDEGPSASSGDTGEQSLDNQFAKQCVITDKKEAIEKCQKTEEKKQNNLAKVNREKGLGEEERVMPRMKGRGMKRKLADNLNRDIEEDNNSPVTDSCSCFLSPFFDEGPSTSSGVTREQSLDSLGLAGFARQCVISNTQDVSENCKGTEDKKQHSPAKKSREEPVEVREVVLPRMNGRSAAISRINRRVNRKKFEIDLEKERVSLEEKNQKLQNICKNLEEAMEQILNMIFLVSLKHEDTSCQDKKDEKREPE